MKKKTLLIIIVATLFGINSSCKSKSSTPVEEATSILVQMYDDTAITLLEQNYSEYKLLKEKVVSRPMHIYLFTYDSKKIVEEELIKQLKTSKLVKEAQSNKNVQLRN